MDPVEQLQGAEDHNTLPTFHWPPELLVLILQHVDLPHRLTSCALVNTSWHVAALAATLHIQHHSNSRSSTNCLQDWLAAHGSQIKTVQLSVAYYRTGVDVQLGAWSCPQLQGLCFSHVTLSPLALTSSSTSSTSSTSSSCSTSTSIPGGLRWDTFKSLTSLSLQYCCIDSLDSLAPVTGLKQLRLEKPQTPGYSPAAASFTLDAAALQPLQQLTSLQVVKGSYKGLVPSIAHMTLLQELHLVRCKDTAATAASCIKLWQQLQHLTRLQVEAVPGLVLQTSSEGSSSGSSSLPFQQLLRLEITSCLFDPSLLRAARRLQHLHLTSTVLAEGAQGTAALLVALQQMHDLVHINLRGTLQQTEERLVHQPVAAAPAEAAVAAGVGSRYTGLTASSRLRHLDLSRCVLPPTAAQALFGAETSSNSSNSNSSSSMDSVFGKGAGSAASLSRHHLPHLQQVLLADTFFLHGSEDMAALVTACPALRVLDLTRATQHDKGLPAGALPLLQQLCHLTSLALCKVDDSAAAELAQLTQLESLSVVWQSAISDVGAQQLTELRRLTQLWVHGNLSPQLAPGYLINLHSKGSPPDVWCQLRDLCHCG